MKAVERFPEEGFLYKKIADDIAQHIKKGTWKRGDKVPSIRKVTELYDISFSTALKAYYELEKNFFIEARPQSGYYVCFSASRLRHVVQTKKADGEITLDSIIQNVYDNLNRKDLINLSMGVPSDELLPIAKLNKAMSTALRKMDGSGTSYDSVSGNKKLRSLIAKRSITWGGHLSEEEVVLTNGCINAVAYALMATTEKGDTIAVQSPTYFGLLQLAESLGLNVIELPNNDNNEFDIDAWKALIKKNVVKALLLISNFSNPLGTCISDTHKKELVQLAELYTIPIIEDDLYGELFFGDKRPSACKTFDQTGIVLWCSSVSKTLAPGYRVGWIAPGRFLQKVQKIKLFQSMATTAITQEAIAFFWETNRYENHLIKMRKLLYQNSIQFIKSIRENFPENCKVTSPSGGLALWVELDKEIDGLELYGDALRQNISIAPGRMFTLGKKYTNCIRLSYGMPWNDKIESSLKALGRIIKYYRTPSKAIMQ
jgi:DNA-binding transcriptional MocR family regulator